MNNYDAVAKKLVPTGAGYTREALRRGIATAIQTEVAAALDAQRVKQFPEIGEIMKGLKEREAKLAVADGELNSREKRMQETNAALNKAVAEREALVQSKESELAAFLKAFGDYAAWLDGDGAVDENGRRFDALRIACKKLKKEKP